MLLKGLSLGLLSLSSLLWSLTLAKDTIYNLENSNYVYDDGEIYALGTCINSNGKTVTYMCMANGLRKYIWQDFTSYDCLHGNADTIFYDYDNSSDTVQFDCSSYSTASLTIYYFNYSADSNAANLTCPSNYTGSLHYSVRSTVLDVCVPGELGYYVWNCSDDDMLYRIWYAEPNCAKSSYILSEDMTCNISNLACSSTNTYYDIGFGIQRIYTSTEGEFDIDFNVLYVVLLIILGFAILLGSLIMCICCGGWTFCQSHFFSSKTPAKMVVTPQTTTTTTNAMPQTQYVPQTQVQYYPQQQMQPIQTNSYGYTSQPVYTQQPNTTYTYTGVQLTNNQPFNNPSTNA